MTLLTELDNVVRSAEALVDHKPFAPLFVTSPKLFLGMCIPLVLVIVGEASGDDSAKVLW